MQSVNQEQKVEILSSNPEKSGIISKNGYHWEYITFGDGPELLFAFHGFDNDAEDFACFEKALGKRYTLVAINLFFHGKSYTEKGLLKPGFVQKDLKELFQEFLSHFNATRFSLMGFSLGGKIVLQLCIDFAEQLNRVILLAPDGIKLSRWYVFLTHWSIGMRLFKRAVKNPDRFFRFAEMLNRMKLVGDKQYKFAKSNFDTAEKRQKVYNVWMIFRGIMPDPYLVKIALEENQVSLHLFFGKHDTIIPASLGKKFIRGLDVPYSLDILEMGHNLLKEKVATEIESRVSDNKKDAGINQHLQ